VISPQGGGGTAGTCAVGVAEDGPADAILLIVAHALGADPRYALVRGVREIEHETVGAPRCAGNATSTSGPRHRTPGSRGWRSRPDPPVAHHLSPELDPLRCVGALERVHPKRGTHGHLPYFEGSARRRRLSKLARRGRPNSSTAGWRRPPRRVSRAHGLTLVDAVAVAVMIGGWLPAAVPVWQRRDDLAKRLGRSKGSGGLFLAGLGLGRGIASAFADFAGWWAVGALVLASIQPAAPLVLGRS
jgi:hypothetical protein